MKLPASAWVLLAIVTAATAAEQPKWEYEIGGPLAGVKLPLLRGENGDILGHPGSIPELAEQAKRDAAAANEPDKDLFTPQGQMPMVKLYPGSVELFRTYYHKYLPIRSFYDVQSQLKLWTAPDLPVVSGKVRAEAYAAPLYWTPRHAAGGVATGKQWKPRTVVRAGVKSPVFGLDLGELSEGLYCVRVVGAVETKNLRPFREPIFITLTVNDRIDGADSRYRVRINYVDEFYSVVEIFFQAPEKRHYRARLFVDEGSTVDLLVRNIVLDDALAGCDFRAMKTKTTYAKVHAWKHGNKNSPERLSRDADIWNAYPRINAQGAGSLDRNIANMHVAFHNKNVLFGADGKDMKQIEEKWGKWEPVKLRGRTGTFPQDEDFGKVFMHNRKLNLDYTVADYQAGKPLPGTCPYVDDGAGSYWPDPENPGVGHAYIPIGFAVDSTRLDWFNIMTRSIGSGDENTARDMAVAFIRFSYQFPAMETANQLPCVISTPGFRNQDSRARKRMVESFWLPSYYSYKLLPGMYDQIFEYIDGNEALAQSIGRFVPWVKSSDDLIRLVDTYLMQTLLKRLMRYNSYTGYDTVGETALVLGDRQVLKHTIDWLYNRAFKYPLRPAGIQDLVVANYDRSGVSYVGSTFYATQSKEGLELTKKFERIGLLPKRYDITDARLFPKPKDGMAWKDSTIVGGLDSPRIGDVRGPDKKPAYFYVAKPGAQAPPPWLDNPSRQVYNWIAALESGLEHHDSRFRRGVYVRIGAGWGHHHNDTLDLQVVALCAPMTIDGGQRPGYSTPPDRMSRLHNTVTIDSREFRGQSWAGTIADAPGARYMRVVAAPPSGVDRFERQVALIDVADGKKDGENVTPPLSYVFDVFRTSGGKVHTYNFHGPINDQLETSVALASVQPPAAGGQAMTPDQKALSVYRASRESWKAGDAGNALQATWRYSRSGIGSEGMMAKTLSPNDPRRFLRLHLTSTENLHVLSAQAVGTRVKYRYSMIRARKSAEETNSSAFGAIIEPYMGTPFVKSVKRLALTDKDEADGPVAIRVALVDGRRDLCFADGTMDKERQIASEVAGGDVKIKAMYAFVRANKDKTIQHAVIAGGTLLDLPDLVIAPVTAEYTGAITKANYLDKEVVIDKTWPAMKAMQVAEIIAGGVGKDRTTSYTINSIRPGAADTSILVFKGGADYYRSSISAIDTEKKTVRCQLGTGLGKMEGLTRNFTASNDKLSKFWRAEYLGERLWRLTGPDVSETDFDKPRSLRVWEYGKGDRVRLRTWMEVRSISKGVYQITGNVGARIAFKAASLATRSADGAWKARGEDAGNGFKAIVVEAEDLPMQVKVTRP